MPDEVATGQEELFDDILIPAPRKAEVWYCSKCEEAGASPEEGYLSIDPRYTLGYCSCTGGRRNRVSGYKHERVQLVADYLWRDPEFQRVRVELVERRKDKEAYDKSEAGLPLKPEDQSRAARHRLRAGMVANKDA